MRLLRDWAFWCFLGMGALTFAFSVAIAVQTTRTQRDVIWVRSELERVKAQNVRSMEDRAKLHQAVEAVREQAR